MISVPSLLPRLNGSKIFILILCSIVIYSCGGVKKAVDNNATDNNQSNASNTQVKEVDTIEWTRVSPSVSPPISGNEVNIESRKKDIYNIALLFPFGTSEFNFSNREVDPDSDQFRFLNYYGGVKMALYELESKGMKFNVNVYDTESNQGAVSSTLLQSNLRNADAIIGPYSSDNLKKAASFAKEQEIPLISPWRASTNITDENPYYIQLRPNLTSYYYALVEDALKDFDSDQVFLVKRNKESDQKRVDRLQTYIKDIGGPAAPSFNEFEVNEDSLRLGETAFDSIFFEDRTSVFIIPNWSFRADEDFIYSCLRRLNVEKGVNNVVVYAMPIVIDSEKMDFNFYRNLNMRVARSKYVDIHNEEVQGFKRRYYNQFYDLPSQDAYEGYDVMTFVGSSLYEYGKSFQYFLGDDSKDYLQMSFDIQKRIDDPDPEFLDPADFSYFENVHLDIYEFVEDRFVKKD